MDLADLASVHAMTRAFLAKERGPDLLVSPPYPPARTLRRSLPLHVHVCFNIKDVWWMHVLLLRVCLT